MEKNSGIRKCRRYQVEGIRGNVLNTTDVDVLNISVDGAAIETPKRLEITREYTFKIRSRNNFLHLKGQVVWAVLVSKGTKNPSAGVPVYRVGLRFKEVLHEKAGMLRRFIEENAMEPRERRVEGIRFKIATAGQVKLDYPYEYRVKKISLAGMLIETGYPLTPGAAHAIELFIGDVGLNIEGKVVNCEKNDARPAVRYDVGVEFVSIPEDDLTQLRGFLRTLN